MDSVVLAILQSELKKIEGADWTTESLKAIKDAVAALNNLSLAAIEGSTVLAKDATVAKAAAVADILPALLPVLYAAVGGPYAITADVLFADDVVVSKDSAVAFKAKEINVGYLSGTLRVVFDTRDPSGASHWVHAQIYKNGVAFGTERDQNGGWFTYSEDLVFAKNDLLQLYVWSTDDGFPIEVRNFRVLGKFPIPQMPAVNL